MDLKPESSCINLVPGIYEFAHYECMHSLGTICLFMQNYGFPGPLLFLKK
jgi:hypothetical protein